MLPNATDITRYIGAEFSIFREPREAPGIAVTITCHHHGNDHVLNDTVALVRTLTRMISFWMVHNLSDVHQRANGSSTSVACVPTDVFWYSTKLWHVVRGDDDDDDDDNTTNNL
jgi:hypothetical protein